MEIPRDFPGALSRKQKWVKNVDSRAVSPMKISESWQVCKNLYKFLLLNQWIDCLEIWYVALDTGVLPRLFK